MSAEPRIGSGIEPVSGPDWMITQFGSIHVPTPVVVREIVSAGRTFAAVRPGPLIVKNTVVAAGSPFMIHRPVWVQVPGTGVVAPTPDGGDGHTAVPTTGPVAEPVVAVMTIPP